MYSFKNSFIKILFSIVFLVITVRPAFADIGFTSTTFSAQEDSGVITVSVNSSETCFGECYDAINIDYSISSGSASLGSDFTSVSGTLSWTAGGVKSFQIPIIPDNNIESNEDFTVLLGNCTEEFFGSSSSISSCSNIVISPATAVATIINDDFFTPGTLSVNNLSVSVVEGSIATISITRTSGSDGAVSVDYTTTNGTALSGSDYTSVSGTLSWSDGESGSKAINLSTISDQENETDESFSLTLSNPTGSASLGGSTSLITLQNLATPGDISLDQSAYSLQEGGQVIATVTRVNGSYGAVSIDYGTTNGTALSGRDYIDTSGTLSWETGEAGSKTIILRALSDVGIEDDEAFTLTLSNLIGDADLNGEGVATITIGNTTIALGEIENLTPEQKAIANTFDGMCAEAEGDLSRRCQEIYNSDLSDDQLKSIIDAIKPTQIAAQGAIAVDFGFKQLQTLHNRIISLKNGKGNRISLDSFSVNSFGEAIPIGKIAQALIYNGLDQEGEALSDGPLGVFIKGQVNIGNKDSTNLEKGFDVEVKSITVGFDYQITDAFILGVAGGYGYSKTDFDSNGGNMKAHSGDVSLYGSYFLPKDFYVDGVFNYAVNAYDNTRTIAYENFQTAATSNPMGNQYGISLSFGKDFYVDSFFLSPYVRMEYVAIGVDEYTEKGGDGLALRVAEQSIASLTSTLGGQISHAFSMPWGIILPGMRFEWQHQYRGGQRNIYAQFIEASAGTGSFAISTDDPDRDYFNLGTSLAITLPEGRSAYLRYETRLGQSDITNHTIELFVRMQF